MKNIVADFTISNENTINAEYSIEQDNFDCSFEIFASGVVWGAITGNIEDQTDLINILNEKATISYVDTNIQSEATSRAESDTLLQNNINTLSDNLTSEIDARTLADNNLQAQIDDINTAGYITKDVNDLSYYMLTTDINTALSGKQNTISDLADIRNNAENGNIAYNTIQNYGDIVTYNADNFATANQGALADTSIQPNDNITLLNNNAGYITGIDNADVVNALGYTPYDSSNPAGYITSASLPTVNNNTITIQKNSVTVDSFTLNQSSNKTINITVPTTASDVEALPNTTNYGTSIDLSLNTTDYKLTLTLKDQNGNTLNSKVVDFPIESVVVNGRYDSTNKKIVLTLQNGTTIDIPVGDLVAGLQTEITSTNKLDADLVDDTNATNKFVTANEKTTWNNKQNAISDLSTIRTNAANGANAYTTIQGYGNIVTHNASEFVTPLSLTTVLTDYVLSSDLSTTLTDYVKAYNTEYVEISSDQSFGFYGGKTSIAGSNLRGLSFRVDDNDDSALNHFFIGTGLYDNSFTLQTLSNSVSLYVPEDGKLAIGRGIFSTGYSNIATETWVGNQGYLTGITSSDVTNALGFTPYNSTNPDGYITNSALTPYALISSLSTVATSGLYSDLTGLPTIPTMTSQLTNNSGFITSADLPTNYLTTDTAQDVSGRKTFLGEKAIYFKQIATSNKLGFTLYNPNNTELGALEYRPSTIGTSSLLAINCPQTTGGYVGFRYWGTPAVNIVAPKVPTAGNYYIPTHITNGSITVTASNTGSVDISSLLPDVSGYVTNTSLATTLADYQPLLVSGTNIKTINNTSLLGSGNIDTSEIFVATYGTTTFSDIFTAYKAGKTIVLKRTEGSAQYYSKLSAYSGTEFSFAEIEIFPSGYTDTFRRNTVDTNNNWTFSNKTYEVTSNKVTSLSSSSTNSQYPSAKCVYDELENKADIDLSNLSTTGQAVIDGKADTTLSNVSSIDSNSAVATELNGKADTDLSNLSTTGQAVIDGQWVSDTSNIVSSNITVTTSYSNNWSLASYLPNDGYNYEVLFSIYGTTATNSGATLDLRMGTDLILDDNNDAGVMALRGQTRTNSSMGYANCLILPVGTGRKVYIRSYGTGVLSVLRVQAYRRLGTNS